MTIASLNDFAADGYAAELDAWCKATLDWLAGVG